MSSRSRYKVIPLEADESEVELAVADPLDMDAIDSISHVIKRSVISRVAPLEDIEKAIHQYYEGAKAEKVNEIFGEHDDPDACLQRLICRLATKEMSAKKRHRSSNMCTW